MLKSTFFDYPPYLRTISLRPPIIMIVLAATAIPVEFRSVNPQDLRFRLDAFDILSNIIGYIPVGLALGAFGVWRTVILAASIATFAEAAQLFMMHRDPSVIDVISNALGAFVGASAAKFLNVGSPTLLLDRRTALGATGLAMLIVFGVWFTSGAALNTRGSTAPGILEAHWKLDANDRIAADSSGHQQHGTFSKGPRLVPGQLGSAVELDGANAINVGDPTAFRLVGSITITAWFKSSAYPVDDAAIVSSMKSLTGFPSRGFQLDTTVDRGARTLAFKVTNECGDLVARYGATPLLLGTWYHAAGVYDAESGNLDVYINGAIDNGFLLGRIGHSRRSSRETVYIGRRSDFNGFEFTGSIDDVRMYSMALTNEEIAGVMRGATIDRSFTGDRSLTGRAGTDGGQHYRSRLRDSGRRSCTWSSEQEDARLPVVVAALGALVAVASIGWSPSIEPRLSAILGGTAGFLLVQIASPTLPSINLGLFPLTSLAASLSVILSARRKL